MKKKTNTKPQQKIKGFKKDDSIIERKLNISGDYQYKALHSKNFLQANWHRNKISVLKKHLKLNKNISVLDIGTGSGNFELFFSKKVKKVVGVDYNYDALLFLENLLTKKQIKNVELIQLDIRKLKSISNLGKFDLVIISDVIEHLKLPEIKSFVKNLKSFLKKDSKVVVITPNYKSPWILLEFILEKFKLVPRFSHAQHLSKLNTNSLEEIFKKNNYKKEKIHTFNLFSFLFPSTFFSQTLCNLETKTALLVGNLIFAIFSYPV